MPLIPKILIVMLCVLTNEIENITVSTGVYAPGLQELRCIKKDFLDALPRKRNVYVKFES